MYMSIVHLVTVSIVIPLLPAHISVYSSKCCNIADRRLAGPPLTSHHLHTFYIHHSNYVMRKESAGDQGKNWSRHWLPVTMKPTTICLMITPKNTHIVKVRSEWRIKNGGSHLSSYESVMTYSMKSNMRMVSMNGLWCHRDSMGQYWWWTGLTWALSLVSVVTWHWSAIS